MKREAYEQTDIVCLLECSENGRIKSNKRVYFADTSLEKIVCADFEAMGKYQNSFLVSDDAKKILDLSERRVYNLYSDDHAPGKGV